MCGGGLVLLNFYDGDSPGNIDNRRLLLSFGLKLVDPRFVLCDDVPR